MSLEQALAENTAAMRDLIAVWSKLTANATAIDAKGSTDVAAAGVPVNAKGTGKAETKKADAPAPAPEKAEAPALDYDKDVKPLIVKLGATADRETVMGVLAKFKVSKGSELKPEQLADAKAALTEAIETAAVA
jgi:hypothetical protein